QAVLCRQTRDCGVGHGLWHGNCRHGEPSKGVRKRGTPGIMAQRINCWHHPKEPIGGLPADAKRLLGLRERAHVLGSVRLLGCNLVHERPLKLERRMFSMLMKIMTF